MRRDFMVCAGQTGWILKVCGTVTAILEFESKDEAVSVGSTLAARHGVDLVILAIGEPSGRTHCIRPAELLAA
ncbi:DUF2188 domain-containing protein [Cupriavidus sp. CuC1]|uniref:DUF2188 domain-containing protein n=1 Tax=Cupriavidus sp. CuC1 TaxID=3373131 RepID=UPI0037D57F24